MDASIGDQFRVWLWAWETYRTLLVYVWYLFYHSYILKKFFRHKPPLLDLTCLWWVYNNASMVLLEVLSVLIKLITLHVARSEYCPLHFQNRTFPFFTFNKCSALLNCVFTEIKLLLMNFIYQMKTTEDLLQVMFTLQVLTARSFVFALWF